MSDILEMIVWIIIQLSCLNNAGIVLYPGEMLSNIESNFWINAVRQYIQNEMLPPKTKYINY